MFQQAFQAQFTRAKKHLVIVVWLVVISGLIIWFGNSHDKGAGHRNLIQAVGYLSAMWLCSYCIDLFALARRPLGNFPVRKPFREAVISLVCPLLGIFFAMLRFSGKVPWGQMPLRTRLPIAIGMILFLFPVGLAVIMLALKYRPKDFGFRLQGFFTGIVVLVITAIAARIVAPGKVTWQLVIQESGGVVGALFTGFIVAALSEEFFRVIVQTRIGAVSKNNAVGWFVASLIWALLHAPNWYNESKDLTETLLSCIRILPLGLTWGYLTYRTQSILPSILCHGMNVWGLQNF